MRWLLLILLWSCAGSDTIVEGKGLSDDVDADGDGYGSTEDCDDSDAAVHPGAAELCDGIDNDCDDQVDEDPQDPGTYHTDA
ncbi:MAG: putative metal-binding motif-containing protein, partial [Myxococcota bacterium]|nr:putative metal-binding motif-containing protein [Myxococcota bacterium]